MDREEWLRRFRARLMERNPSIPANVLGELAGDEAYESLSAEYPEDPEKAVDDEANDWPEHHK
jgi:hypothetical protein